MLDMALDSLTLAKIYSAVHLGLGAEGLFQVKQVLNKQYYTRTEFKGYSADRDFQLELFMLNTDTLNNSRPIDIFL